MYRGESAWPLRVAWMLWLASFLVLFAMPLLFGRLDSWLGPLDAPSVDEPWSWDLELIVPMGLALVLPSLVHGALARRVGSAFFLEQRRAVIADYRSPQPWGVTTSRRALRMRIGLHAGRLGLAMALSAKPFSVLMSTRFVNDWGCLVFPYVRSVPEHLTFTMLLFIIALFHVPTTARVLGARPSVATARGPRRGEA
ncbi:hypothetical protein BH11MYX4_BH11MYX4_50140 [soil metagenome]